MKQWIFGLFMLSVSLAAFAQAAPEDEFKSLSPEDQELLSKVVKLVDEGLSEAVIPDFDLLAKKYPKNYLVQYERAYNLYMLGRYDEVLKLKKFLLNHKFSTERTYQLIGNSYDNSGDSKKAVKVYEEGLKRFPHSGSLYLELGAVSLSQKDYDKALEYYNRGILAQPDFASNYYRAAMLYLASERGKVWGLVYAETAVLLAPSNDERHEVMAASIVDCLKESVRMSFGDKDSLSVKLTPNRNIQIDEKTKDVYLDFPGIYEAAIELPLNKMFMEKVLFTGSLSQLIEVRRGLVENYFSVTDNLYGSSMYLLEFQKKIIDAGHWDAYNYFLFMPCFPEEFEAWYSADNAPLDSFIDWYNNAPFILGDGRSVNPMQIFDHYRPVDMMESLTLQYKLLGGTASDDDEGEEEK